MRPDAKTVRGEAARVGDEVVTVAQVAALSKATGLSLQEARSKLVYDALKGRMISWPFTLYDCAAQSDGASAAIITRQDLARTFRDDAVSVRGISIILSANPQSDPTFDFLAWKPTVAAAKDVYAQAGISNPMQEIDLAQVHDCFTMTELPRLDALSEVLEINDAGLGVLVHHGVLDGDAFDGRVPEVGE